MQHTLTRSLAAAALVVGAVTASQAQDTARVRSDIKIRKDSYGNVSTTRTTMTADTATSMSMAMPMRVNCTNLDLVEARKVAIKTDLYTTGMVSPDSAKAIALCAVPGQISSGEMNRSGDRVEYAIDILPTDKKTHTKVIVDAQTGEVISTKQFGGLRGAAGYIRESAERNKNKTKAATDTTRKP